LRENQGYDEQIFELETFPLVKVYYIHKTRFLVAGLYGLQQ